MFKLSGAAVILFLCIAAVLSIASDSGAQTLAAPSAKVHAGEEIFTQRCMQCHAVHEGQTSFGPNLQGELKKPHHQSNAEVRTIIKAGKGKMPAFSEKLTPAELDDLVAYMHTL